MLHKTNGRHSCAVQARFAVGAVTFSVLSAFMVGTLAAQYPSSALQSASGTAAVPLGKLVEQFPFSKPASVQGSLAPPSEAAPVEVTPPGAGSTASSRVSAARTPRRITLEEAKQQVATNSVNSPLARLGQLSLEAARQHVLVAEGDYYAKISATVANLHYSDFLGQVLTLQRPLTGGVAQVPIPIFNQDQTAVAVTMVQPITPLFQVYQMVKIARADERITMAKTGPSVARNTSAAQLEESYFKLMIAQRRLTLARLKLNSAQNRPLYASTSPGLVRAPSQEPELLEAKAVVTVNAEVDDLTASLNRMLGWPEDTQLELVSPSPLVENITLEDVADKSLSASPDVVEAEQTVVKARAASVLSKLAYMPTIAAVAGFVYQNVIPVVPNTFGYGGVMISYNLFDFGKREAAVREASAQLGMAETAVQLTKAKVSASLKTSFSDLERTRQLSEITQKMGSSVTMLVNVSSTPESVDMTLARTNAEVEMLEADLAHRKAYARLKAVGGAQLSK